jgi:LysR family transcriptional regulator, regulator for bpeEF and oprC
MDQLLAIRSFIRVAETGSFSRAADSLNMPKATVSKLIKELGGHVGARLLQRTTRRVSVTADGNASYGRTARLIRELEDADQGFSAGHVLPEGRIRTDVIGTLARLFIIPALPEFFARYPDMQIDFGISDKSADMRIWPIDRRRWPLRYGRTPRVARPSSCAELLPWELHHAVPGTRRRAPSIAHTLFF